MVGGPGEFQGTLRVIELGGFDGSEPLNKPIRYAPCWVLCLFLSGMAGRLCRAETKTIAVDYESSTGTIDIVLGIEGNPVRWTHAYGLVDMAAKMHDLRITHNRTANGEHSHPTTFEGIFPDWRAEWWTASDEPFEATANYNFDNANHTTPVPGTCTYAYFHSTDGKIDDSVNKGFSPLFTLGTRQDTFDWWHRFHTLGYTYSPTLFHQSSIDIVNRPLNLAVCGGFPGIGQSAVQGHGAY